MTSLALHSIGVLLWAQLLFGQYSGTATVTRGLATTIQQNLFSCTGARIAGVGTISASDSTRWIVPAQTHFSSSEFPFASDLYNSCNGNEYSSAAKALSALDGHDIINIDADGELITAYVFADNYFEMYVNGVAVGKDKVPYTPFNSSIVRFRVHQPFVVAMMLVDWEEHLGVGAESNNGFAYHDGDGGMVAVFSDAARNIIGTSGSGWKAQTFYTAPIVDLRCAYEEGTTRYSTQCSTKDVVNGSGNYALHWALPQNWMQSSFDDASWPAATLYTNAEIGIDNKPAYQNFRDVFDDPQHDARFIWSTNVVLDNLVIVRARIGESTSLVSADPATSTLSLVPNPSSGILRLVHTPLASTTCIQHVRVVNSLGLTVLDQTGASEALDLSACVPGVYMVLVYDGAVWTTLPFVRNP